MIYCARLIMSAHYKQAEIAFLNIPFEDITTAHVALRQENHDQSPWLLEWFFADKPSSEALNKKLALGFEIAGLDQPKNIQWTIEAVPQDIDWLEHSYKQFPAFAIGDFFVYGSHHDGAVPDDKLGLQIDAATAFGSGEHGTTEGCLRAMIDLEAQGVCPWNILDMGTGSGILAIGAYKLWKTPVLAIDNDPESIAVTKRHAQANNVKLSADQLSCLVNEGFEGQKVQKRGPFDLIIANILAGPLMTMVTDLVETCDDGCYVILSGILQTQAKDVIKTYKAQGLVLKKTYDIGEWSTLLMHNP